MNLVKVLASLAILLVSFGFASVADAGGCGAFVNRDFVVVEQVVVPVRQQVIQFVEVPNFVVKRVVVNRNRVFVRNVRRNVVVERRVVRRRGLLGLRREVVVERFLAR